MCKLRKLKSTTGIYCLNPVTLSYKVLLSPNHSYIINQYLLVVVKQKLHNKSGIVTRDAWQYTKPNPTCSVEICTVTSSGASLA